MLYSLTNGATPKIDETTMIAETAQIIGNVEIGQGCSIWFGAVLRGDVNKIVIGDHSNVQDNCVVHVSEEHQVIIGDCVTIGHNAVLHSCKVENNCMIGIGSIILDGAVIMEGSIVGAGSVVPPGMIVPSNSLVMGVPARIVKQSTKEQAEGIKQHSSDYEQMWKKYY